MDFDNENDFPDYNQDNSNKGDEITIDIKNIKGDSNTFKVKITTTIGELIKMYKNSTTFPNNTTIVLTYGGKIVKENQTIQNCNIEDGESLYALIRLKGGN